MTDTIAPYRSDGDFVAADMTVRTIADEAAALTITDEATNAHALDLLSQARKGVKRLEALRARWLDPLNNQLKVIRADFDEAMAPAKRADNILAAKTSAYRAQVAAAARAEEDRLRALAAARQERAVERAEAKGVEPPPPPPFVPTIPEPPKSVATAAGSKVTFRRQVHFEIEDATLVPRPFWDVNESRVRAAAAAGLPIPGVRIWWTEEPVVR